jgi:Fe-S cluster biogenesis protein NfuA
MEDSGSERPALLAALETVIAPLVEADGGELYLLPLESAGGSSTPSPIRLHLGGRFSGCPGNALVSEHIIRPALEAIAQSRQIEVSSGRLVPSGAERIFSRTAASS